MGAQGKSEERSPMCGGEAEGPQQAVQESHPSVRQEDRAAEKLRNELKPKNIRKSLIVANTLSLGLIQTWFLAVLFVPDAFAFGEGIFKDVAVFQEVSLLAWLVAIATGFLFRGVPFRRWRIIANTLMVCAPLCLCAYFASHALSLPSVVVSTLGTASYLLFGAALGMAFGVWVRLFCRFVDEVAICVGLSLVVAGLGVWGLSCASVPVAITVMALLPVAVMLVLGHFDLTVRESDRSLEAQSTELDDTLHAPRRLWLSLGAVGFVFGLSYGYVAASMESLRANTYICVIACVALGLLLAGYFLRTGRNPGYTVPLALLLALGCIGQGLISVLRDFLLPLSFAILFAGEMLFQSVLLLQLPLVYRKKKSLATFFALWFTFFAAQVLGLLLRHLLLVEDHSMSFELVSAAALVISVSIMALALRDTSVSTAWDYMPLSVFTRKRYAEACGAVQQRYGLTPREREIMMLVGRGRNGTYVQEKLVISKSTYQTHMRNLYKKLDIHSDQELIDLIEDELRLQKET